MALLLLLVALCVSTQHLTEVLATNCKPSQFDCGDGTCISNTWVCDSDLDCPSGIDERQDCCAEGKQFECKTSGHCVGQEYTCDSFYDCEDGSDERNCTTCVNDELFHCNNDRCVDPVFICDGDNDCGDFSDEMGCDEAQTDGYLCQDGSKVVSRSQLCDRINHCGDMSDEIGCAPCDAFQFQCHNNEACVLVFDLCDGTTQCSDGSDEYWCEKCDNNNEFKCRNGRCIPKNRVCNLLDDCGDKSDEDECSCDPVTEFTCASGVRDYFNASNVRCITNTWLCDKMNDCNNGEDEDPALCAGRVAPTPEVPAGCTDDQFQCMDGYCINATMTCDGIPQCKDGEDEMTCPVRCTRGTYQLCLTGDECLTYDQFCDGVQDCADNSDESFSNGYCVCSGILCGGECVPIEKVCDAHWDCRHGEDEALCTQCRPNLHNTKALSDQTTYVINLIRTTYGEIDNFHIYFSGLSSQWVELFGEKSPFDMDPIAIEVDTEKVISRAQEFLISIVSQRTTLRHFMSVLKELGFTTIDLPRYEDSPSLNYRTITELTQQMKRYTFIEKGNVNALNELLERSEYLRQKAQDANEVLNAITKTLHFDFVSCRDPTFLSQPLGHKRSMRDVFTALTLVQGGVPREEIDAFIDLLYELNSQLRQLIVSVHNYDQIIVAVASLIDQAAEKMEEESHVEDERFLFFEENRDGSSSSYEEKKRRQLETALTRKVTIFHHNRVAALKRKRFYVQ